MSLTGGSFIIEQTAPNSVFIPEEWTEEQLMIRDMIHDFIEKELHTLPKEPDASTDRDFIVELLDKSAELGLCGLSIEPEHGGMGLDFNTGLLFGEAVAPGFSFATTIGAQTSIGSLPIVYYGTPEQKAKYLPKIASAEYKASYALTEPEAGSDANSGKTKAILTEDGKHYILNGQKMWITNGGFAHIFIVFAKIDNDENLSAFIVEKDFGGITIGEEEKKLGIKGSSTVQVFFNDCKVPAENLLANRGDGFKIALNILNSGRIKLAAGSIGGSKFALTKAIEYANERKQFDKSISEFGAIKYKIGEMARMTFATESAIYRTGRNIDLKEMEFKSSDPEGSKLKALREYAVECAILKVYGSEVVDYCVDETLQVYGGMGYSVEAGVEMGYRDARITRIYEGTNEINRLLSFGELMKRAFKTKEIDLLSAGKSIPGYLFKQSLPFKSSSGYNEANRTVENIKKLFLIISGIAGKKLKLAMVDEQELVMDLSDILAEAYISESLLLRIQKLEQKNPSDPTLEVKKKILNLHLYTAVEKVKCKAINAIDSLPDNTKQKFLKWATKKLMRQIEINPKDTRREIADYFIKEGKYTF